MINNPSRDDLFLKLLDHMISSTLLLALSSNYHTATTWHGQRDYVGGWKETEKNTQRAKLLSTIAHSPSSFVHILNDCGHLTLQFNVHIPSSSSLGVGNLLFRNHRGVAAVIVSSLSLSVVVVVTSAFLFQVANKCLPYLFIISYRHLPHPVFKFFVHLLLSCLPPIVSSLCGVMLS